MGSNFVTFIFAAIITPTINCDKLHAIEWKWKYTLDADAPENYVVDEYSKDCHGFYFPDFDDICMMSLDKLRTSEIFLPKAGYIYLKEGAEIVLDPTVRHCIKVKPTGYKEWLSPASWTSKRLGNLAVPHLERTPCRCDEVIFPDNSLYAVSFPTFPSFVKNIRYGVVLGDNSCPLDLPGGEKVVSNPGFCRDEISCQDNLEGAKFLNELCPVIRREKLFDHEGNCEDGVELVGHCDQFCGAVIHIGDDLKNLRPGKLVESIILIDGYDVYHSKVVKNGRNFLQISITDKKEYTGDSALKVEGSKEEIIEMAKNWGVFDIEINTSGPPRNKSGAKQSFLVVFGTLLFVLLIFGALYGVYEKNIGLKCAVFDTRRFNLSRYNQALRRSVIFSRFDNRENVSIAGSALCLAREEFNNPLYEEGEEAEEVAIGSKNGEEEEKEEKEDATQKAD